MKTSELAAWLNVSTASLRYWTLDETIKPFLSDTARGGSGKPRFFDEQDARIIAFIAAMKSQQNSQADIVQMLGHLQADGWADLPPMPPAPAGTRIDVVSREAAETAVMAQRTAMVRQIAFLEDRVESLEEQLIEERAGRAEEREALQGDLLAKTATLGELKGRLDGIEAERSNERATWRGERQLLLRGLIVVAVVAGILLAVVVLLALTGGPLGG